MANPVSLCIYNGQSISLRDVPEVVFSDFRETVIGSGGRLVAMFGRPGTDDEHVKLTAILALEGSGTLRGVSTQVGNMYESLTGDFPQAHWFEREIAEQWGVRPIGHPWLKPLRFHESYRSGHDAWGRQVRDEISPGVTDFFQVRGEEVHEVAVGPIHAGIIEPGHFRFQCHGEKVFHLEISLGYQHRGIERSLVGGPNKRTIFMMESAAGDTTIGHARAYCQILESLAHCRVSARAQAIRGIALELERLANHIGDLGAISGDIGYLPTASFCGRIRGDFLNMTALVCGSRFGRGLVRPGGVGFDLEPARIDELLGRLEQGLKDATVAIELFWEKPSVMARLEETGRISLKTCHQLGLVGPAARACGVERDTRFDYPSGIYQFSQIPISTWHTGDVFARAYVRWLEIQRSIGFIKSQLESLPEGPIREEQSFDSLEPSRLVVSLEEGWRGEICHVGITDEAGRIAHYKIIDPSFHNWMGLAMALRDQQISDFPLCNKSFNLSYCGHDL